MFSEMKQSTKFVAAVLCVLLLGISTPLKAAGTEITVAGSSTVRPIIEQAALDFKKTHSNVKFVIGGGGSSHGVKSVATGEVLLGLASRAIKDKETEKWNDLVPVKIGLDGIAVIVNSKNPVKKVTKQQIQDIYTGKITNWKEVGGKNARISLISKEEGRSTLELFLKYFELEAQEIGKGKSAVMAHRKKPKEVKKEENGEIVKEPAEEFSKVTAKLIGPNREAIAAVSVKSNVIAYVSVGTAQEVAAKGGRIRLLKLDGVVATVNNVANETYPLRRPLNVITKGQARGSVKEFIDFLTSEQGQKIVSSLEFVPVQRKVAKSN